ncbi:MAG: hypothetical protein ABF679_03195 [Lentilactobacillus diolivorans]
MGTASTVFASTTTEQDIVNPSQPQSSSPSTSNNSSNSSNGSYDDEDNENDLQDIQNSNQSYEETSKLPHANDIPTTTPGNNSPVLSSSPNSIKDYKKLGYSHFSYSRWSGVKNYTSTKTARIAKFMSEQLLNLIPIARIPTIFYDVSQTIETQTPDIWPTSNLRNITAKNPRGYTSLIGQQSVVKYYSNSSRTNLVKTIKKTYWVG